jgi:hypothetical protein
MQKQPIINTFNEGMVQDIPESLAPKNTYQWAKNAVLADRESLGLTLSNEESNKLVADVGEPIVGQVFVEAINSSIIFSASDKISIFDHDKEILTEVMTAGEFGCSWGFNQCEWIDPEYKFMQSCDELHVYFSSNCTYHVVNITEMLNPVRKAALKASIIDGNALGTNCDLSCQYFNLFSCVCTPKFTADISEKAGHRLENGVYKFAVQLEGKDGSTTNWSEVSQPLYIGGESNQPGEISTASINLHLTGLDCRYDVVNIAVINGYGAAEVVGRLGYSTDGVTFTYYGQTGRAIDLSEIITKQKKYLRGRSLEQKDSRLYLYNIRQEKNPNMQRRVFESAKLEFITVKTSARLAERYNIKSLQRGERYMFGVVYKYCDGTHSPVFLLAPKGGGGSDKSTKDTASKPGGTEEIFERIPGNNRTGVKQEGGCSGGNCGGSGGGKVTPRSESSPDQAETVDSWNTELPNWENSARCNDCHPPICCQTDEDGNVTPVIIDSSNCDGCSEDEQTIGVDGPKLEQEFATNADNHTEWMNDGNNRPNSTTILDAAKALLNALKSAEVIKRTAAKYNVTTKVGSTSSGGASTDTNNVDSPIPTTGPTNTQIGDGVEAGTVVNISGGGDSNTVQSKGVPPPQTQETQSAPQSDVAWGDELHNLKGQHDFDGKEFEIVERWAPRVETTIHKYPDTRDCDGEYLYGSKANTPVELFGVPFFNESPAYEPNGKGVPNKTTPSADPQYMSNIRHIGIEVTGVPLPGNDEDWFPKPLCPNEPYRIVMVERDYINSTVQGNVFATQTFQGISGGETFNFPRHGLNSKDKIDFHINNGGSHKGTDGGTVYNFYSLDLGLKSIGLSATRVRNNARVNAQGHRYGLYAEGQKPKDGLGGRRVDQRGARQFINANMPQTTGGELQISGIGYANGNTPHIQIDGIDNPCTTAYREGSVFAQLSGELGPTNDASFKTDTLDHEVPIGTAWGFNASLERDIPDQYGHVTGMKFIDTGVRANGFRTGTRGICGDIYIGPYSFVKKGFVSDKVGDTFDTPGRPRTVCDSADDLILQNLDINHYPTRLPKSGDRSDARNWAGGYNDRNALLIQNTNPEPINDFYYPKVVKTLITTVVESRNNPWLRATGTGNQRELGIAYYPNLKGMFLDSNQGTNRPWEYSFLNRFFFKVEQPSQSQLLRKALIRNLVEIALPALGLLEASGRQLPTDITAYFVVLPGLIAYWKLMRDLVTREDYLNKMVGIQDCKIDSEGPEPEDYIENYEDNYHINNIQYSVNTTENIYFTPPLNYSTCVCDSCIDQQTTNEIYFSLKQNPGSPTDSYRNFQSIPFNELGTDKGKLRKLFKWQGKFYAHTTEGLFVIKLEALKQISDIGLLNLFGTHMITDPVALYEGVPEGFIGIQDPNSSILTPFGYFFVDREAKRVYLFDGGAPKEISAQGMYNFFKDNIDFCNIGACHDEKNEGSTYYSLGWDNRYNRLLLTKKSQNSKESFTISYYPLLGKGGKWGSFHDYIPQFYMWDRDKMFTGTGGKIYKHNVRDNYQRFYDTKSPFEVQFTANLEDYTWFTYQGNIMHTDAAETASNIKGLDITFDQIAAWNYTQGTGQNNFNLSSDNKGQNVSQLDMIKENIGNVRLRMAQRKYTFNELYDFKIKGCGDKPMTLKDNCEYYPRINNSIFDCSVLKDSSFGGKTIIDDHLTYRLTYNGDREDVRLRLIDFKTNHEKSTQ